MSAKTPLAARWTLLAAFRALARRHYGGSLWRLREALLNDLEGAGLLGSAADLQHRLIRHPTRMGQRFNRERVRPEHLAELLAWAQDEPYNGRPAFQRY